MTETALPRRHRALAQQGFSADACDLAEIEWGLRFTPAVCMALAVTGLVTQQPAIHFVLAALGIGFFWLPAWHPFDLVYNRLLRPLWNGVTLPPNPLPRRIACFMGGSMNLGIGLAFLAGNPVVAYALGAVLIPLQIIVITTHFCVASWMYEGLLRSLGGWTTPISAEEARALVAGGATLVDVREPHEFAGGHLPGAVNIPVQTLPRGLDPENEAGLVLYCHSGMRSQRAVRVLKRAGRENVHNLGAMSRWKQ